MSDELEPGAAPVSKLPPELLGYIFTLLIPENGPIIVDCRNITIFLASVCTTWRDVTLSTPALWVSLCLPCPAWASERETIKAILTRSGDLRLNLYLGLDEADATDLIDTIRPHIWRCDRLDISRFCALMVLGGQSLFPGHDSFPNLQILCHDGQKPLQPSEGVGILRKLHNVVTVRLHIQLAEGDQDNFDGSENIRLLSLRHLYINAHGGDGPLFGLMNTPVLESLGCVDAILHPRNSLVIPNLLLRSRCSLLALEIRGPRDDVDGWCQCLRLSPNLEWLKLHESFSLEATKETLQRLTINSNQSDMFLPKLRIMTLELFTWSRSEDLVAALVVLVESRRDRLKELILTCRNNWHQAVQPTFSEATLTSLLNLRKHGLNFHFRHGASQEGLDDDSVRLGVKQLSEGNFAV